MSFVEGALADWTDQSFRLAGGINADEVEDLAVVHVSFLAFEVLDFYLFDEIRLAAHGYLIFCN